MEKRLSLVCALSVLSSKHVNFKNIFVRIVPVRSRVGNHFEQVIIPITGVKSFLKVMHDPDPAVTGGHHTRKFLKEEIEEKGSIIRHIDPTIPHSQG
jgi:hypothetical protein